LTLSPNKISAFFCLLIAVLFSVQNISAQVFPDVAGDRDEPQEKKRTMEEDREVAMHYYRTQDYEKAAESFRNLFDESPSHIHYTYLLLSLVELQEFEEAEKVAKKMHRKIPIPRYEVDLGYIYNLQDKTGKADKIFDGLIDDLKPSRGEVSQLANAFLNRKEFDYAARAYLKGRELMKGEYMFHNELARLYHITGNYESMISEYLQLLEENPNQLSEIQNRLQNLLDRDTDGSLSESLRNALLKKNQANPDNIYFSQMLLWHSIQKKDFDFAMIQAISLDKRLGEDGERVFALGGICLSNKAYEVASEGFEYIMEKGPGYPYYIPARTGNLRARFLLHTNKPDIDQGKIDELAVEYETTLEELGKSPETIRLRRDYAHLIAFYQGKMDKAMDILEESISLPGAPSRQVAGSKIELADIYLFTGDVWEATLLYSQVEKAFKNDPVGHTAKLRNARLSFYIGEFDWARAQLDVLKAATSKFIANDALELSLLISDNMDPDSTYTGLSIYSKAELLSYQNKDSLALVTLDSISMLGLWHPLNDEVLFSKAKIYIKQGDFKQADTLLQKVVEMYPYEILADNALFKRGDLYENVFENSEKAMALYQQLLIDYPGSLLTTEARRRFRALRGDNTDS